MQYRGDLNLPVTLEAHVINDAAHSKVAAWLPQSEKMQAELEGNRISRTLNVRALKRDTCTDAFLIMTLLGNLAALVSLVSTAMHQADTWLRQAVADADL